MAQKKKNPKKNSKSSVDTIETTVISVLFLILILTGFYMFYTDSKPEEAKVVAEVNEYEITEQELDWWYDITINENAKADIPKKEFLESILVPQTVLVEEARTQGFEVSDEEIERVIGLYIIEEGITVEEFLADLESRGLTNEDIQKSFEARVLILKLFDKEKINYIIKDGLTVISETDLASRDYINDLVDRATIEYMDQPTDKEPEVQVFEKTGDSCDDTVARLFITSTCKTCESSSKIFKNILSKEDISAAIWVLNKGDNSLTKEKEKAVPEAELAFFRKYADKKVPALIIGCEHRYIGEIKPDHEEPLNDIVKGMVK